MEITHEAQFGNSRIFKIKIKEKEIFTPIFFPAVSSVDIRKFESILNWLIEKKPINFLVSGYDINTEIVRKFPIKETFLMLDSGGYEIRNLEKKSSWSLNNYKEIIEKLEPDIIISLDLPDNQNPIQDYLSLKSNLNEDVFLEFVISETNPKKIPNMLISSLQEIQPNAIAIPERNLGLSFIERLKTVRKVSNILQNMENPILFHILGCSDPDSIIKYANEGVDLFDGLGWYKRAVFYKEIKNNKYKLYSDWSFIDSSKLSDCNCFVCKKADEINHLERVLSHNLLAYSKLCEELQMYIIEGGKL